MMFNFLYILVLYFINIYIILIIYDIMDLSQTKRINKILLPTIENYSTYKNDLKRNENSLVKSFDKNSLFTAEKIKNINFSNIRNNLSNKNNNIIESASYPHQKVFNFYNNNGITTNN